MKPTTRSPRRASSISMQVRLLHAYVGMFIAPTVIFFAATGVLQIYSLHEAHPGYSPPPLIEKLGAVHKDQRFAVGHKDHADAGRPASAAPAAGPPHAGAPAHGGEKGHAGAATGLLKAFFAAVAVSLIFSTCAGVWMALQQPLRRRAYLALLAIGVLAPVILAALTM